MSQERQAIAATSGDAAHERVKKNLPGAAKRRLKKLLDQGMEYARARELCLQPIVAPSQGTNLDPTRLDKTAFNKRGQKRNRSEECSPKEHPKKATKLETAKPTFKEVISAIKIGIKAEDRLMSETELSLLQSSILEQIDEEAPGGKCGPRFLACSYRDGWLCITCVNEHSQKWLTERVNTFRPWEGAKLAIMLEKDFPRPYIGVMWVPGPVEDPKRVLHRIRYQNDHLDCARWRLLNCTPGEKGQHITFSMAQSSFELLQKHGLTISYGFGPIAVRIKAPKAHASEARPESLVEQREPIGLSTAAPDSRQDSIAPPAELVTASVATPFRGGNADAFDPQQPGPSGSSQASASGIGVSRTEGMAQVRSRDLTAVLQTQRGQRGISGATPGPANSNRIILGRPGSGRPSSANQHTMPSQIQRGVTRRGRGKGSFKVPSAKNPTPKNLAPKKP